MSSLCLNIRFKSQIFLKKSLFHLASLTHYLNSLHQFQHVKVGTWDQNNQSQSRGHMWEHALQLYIMRQTLIPWSWLIISSLFQSAHLLVQRSQNLLQGHQIRGKAVQITYSTTPKQTKQPSKQLLLFHFHTSQGCDIREQYLLPPILPQLESSMGQDFRMPANNNFILIT